MRNIMNFRFVSLLLALLTASGAVSCGSAEGTEDTLSALSSDEAVQEGYAYPDVNYGGYTFRILNYDTIWACKMAVDITEQNGDVLDDTIYARNRSVEEKLNFKIEEIRLAAPDWSKTGMIIDTMRQSVMADDDDYDVGYLPLSFGSSILTEGYLVDLKTMPELSLSEAWWDPVLNNTLTINGKLYAATSSFHLMGLDLTWVLLFNKRMMDDLSMDYPYELVRGGEWTLDKMNEYVSAMAMLNGDDSFAFNADGSCVYGIAGHNNAPYVMMIAAQNSFITAGDDGLPAVAEIGDRLYSTVDKINAVMNVADGNCLYSKGSSDADAGFYTRLFKDGRAAFLTTELKGALKMRDMTDDYGILPMPKYDAAQKNYITFASENICRLTVPITNSDLSRTGVILDALSYESSQTVMPVYYDQMLSQKGLRDEDSIEMLNLIYDNRMTEIGQIFGITGTLISALNNMVAAGNNTAASTVASNQETIKAKLADILSYFK
ncbi:MAG: hypothetical protein E7632_05570 [Ruminococcaceae bacterium]|nr:hypothetical protein [Oscillospiraceae bacterium]